MTSSWRPARIASSLPYELDEASVAVAITNRGAQPEPVTALIGQEPRCRPPPEPEPLHQSDLVIGAGKTANFTLKLPTDSLPEGRQSLTVLLCAVNNRAQNRSITLNFTRRPPTVDAEIVSIAARPARSTMRGLPVEIRVTMRNNDSKGAYLPVLLHFPAEDKQPERRSPYVGPGATATVTFVWKTGDYAVGEHTLRAELVAENNIADGDTSAALSYRIDPLRLDAAIGDIGVVPAAPVAGEAVAITVPARNNGPIAGNLPVTLYFPSDDKQPETRRPYTALGATETAAFTWRTGDYAPGTYTFRVRAGATASQSFTIELLPPAADFAVTELRRPDPARPIVKGDWADVAATVTNTGPYAGRAAVTLRALPAGPDAGVGQDIAVRSVDLAAGASATVDFAWHTRRYPVGQLRLQAVASAPYDANLGNNASDPMPVTILTDRDITLDSASAVTAAMAPPRVNTAPHIISYAIVDVLLNPKQPAVSDPVAITVRVRNDGTHAANVPVTLYFPSPDKQPETRRPRIAPGQTGTATFTWRTGDYSPGTHTFQVRVGTKASQSFTIELLLPAADFAVTELRRPNPARPIVRGDQASVAATVTNIGPYAGRAAVTLRALPADPDAGTDADAGQDIAVRSVDLAAGASAIVDFAWHTRRYPVGELRLQAVVSAPYDANPGNNASDPMPVPILTDRDITLDSASAVTAAMAPPRVNTAPHIISYAIADVLLNPERPAVTDPVAITVRVRNDGTHAANVPVTLHFPSPDKQPETRRPRIAPGANRNGDIHLAHRTLPLRQAYFPRGSANRKSPHLYGDTVAAHGGLRRGRDLPAECLLSHRQG